jgi:two-component system, NtrC family, sensor histidine kinase HydH
VTALLQKSEPENSCKAIEELSRLTGGLAHEIKNPLSTIKINLKLISEDLDKTDPKLARPLRKLAIVQKETDRIERILEDFLRYAGRTELQPATTDINELVGDMVDFYMPQAQSHSITLRLGLSKERLMSRVDIVMFKQVLLNLFINAQQAMPMGGELIIRTYKKGNDGVVEIGDTGTGIEPERLEKIFEAYYSSKPSGSGLGLPIAKKIISQHDGTIGVSSEMGKGTLFTIRLPLIKD